MSGCLRAGSVLGLALVTLAPPGTGWNLLSGGGPDAKTSAKPSTARMPRRPDTPYRYADIDLPAHFKTPLARRFDNTPADNPVTDAGATLGRVLFYDTRLSANNTVSCGSCHVQKHAFVDPSRFSKGFEGKQTDRHAMGLVN